MKIINAKEGRNTIFSDIKIFVESLFDIDDEYNRYNQSILGFDNCFICNINGTNIGLCKSAKDNFYISLLNNNEPIYLIFVKENLLELDSDTIYSIIESVYDIIFKIFGYDKLTIYINISRIFALYSMVLYFDNISWENIYDKYIKDINSSANFIFSKKIFGDMCNHTIEELYCDNKILDFI